MKRTFTASVYREDDAYVAQALEVDVALPLRMRTASKLHSHSTDHCEDCPEDVASM